MSASSSDLSTHQWNIPVESNRLWSPVWTICDGICGGISDGSSKSRFSMDDTAWLAGLVLGGETETET